jgi:hypothetical protein
MSEAHASDRRRTGCVGLRTAGQPEVTGEQSGRGSSDPSRRCVSIGAAGPGGLPQMCRPSAACGPEAEMGMFEPLGRTQAEKSTGTGRRIHVAWAFVLVAAVVVIALAIIA